MLVGLLGLLSTSCLMLVCTSWTFGDDLLGRHGPTRRRSSRPPLPTCNVRRCRTRRVVRRVSKGAGCRCPQSARLQRKEHACADDVLPDIDGAAFIAAGARSGRPRWCLASSRGHRHGRKRGEGLVPQGPAPVRVVPTFGRRAGAEWRPVTSSTSPGLTVVVPDNAHRVLHRVNVAGCDRRNHRRRVAEGSDRHACKKTCICRQGWLGSLRHESHLSMACER
jgi:hypothetical protein